MQNSKLVRALKILNAKELKRLLPFLKSPFHNSNVTIIDLYLLVRSHHPSFDSPKLNKEKIFKKLFKGRPYDNGKFLNLMSDFNALVEEYLVLVQLEKEKVAKQKLLLRAYAERPGAYVAFRKQSRLINDTLDEMPYRDEIYYFEKKNLHLINYAHPGNDMYRGGATALPKAAMNLEDFYALAEIKLKCATYEWISTVGGKYTMEIPERNETNKNILLEFYERLSKLQREKNDKDLQLLTEFFIKHVHKFRQEDQSNIIKILVNYGIRYINSGKSGFTQTNFLLYKTGLEHNCLFTQGKLTERTFLNIISTALNLKELDWAKNFMDDYINRLDETIRKDAHISSLAQWYYCKGELHKALDYLQHNFKGLQNNLTARILSIRIWFELLEQGENYYELLLNKLDTFERFIRREKTITDRLSSAYLKFIYWTRKLVLCESNLAEIDKVKSSIKSEPNIVLKTWLIENT